jgi:hypothetical protein
MILKGPMREMVQHTLSALRDNFGLRGIVIDVAQEE